MIDCQDWDDDDGTCQVYFVKECRGLECISRVPFVEKKYTIPSRTASFLRRRLKRE